MLFGTAKFRAGPYVSGGVFEFAAGVVVNYQPGSRDNSKLRRGLQLRAMLFAGDGHTVSVAARYTIELASSRR